MADGELNLDQAKLNALGNTLASRLTESIADRRGKENEWIQSLRQYKGKYDPEMCKGWTDDQSRAYPKLTRVKVRSIVARLHALLFPAGEKNWDVTASPVPSMPTETLLMLADQWQQENPDTKPTQEALDLYVKKHASKVASLMATIINDQLGDTSALDSGGNYQDLARVVLDSGVMYGTGVLKGPMTLEESGSSLVVSDGVITVEEGTTYRPCFEAVSIWDYYPDMSAKTYADMRGQFQRHVYTKAGMVELQNAHGFISDAVKRLLADKPDGNYHKKNYEDELDSLTAERDGKAKEKSGRYELFEYWGELLGSDLQAGGVEVPEDQLNSVFIGSVWFTADKHVVKVARSPWGRDVQMYHKFVFEDDHASVTGVGLPHIMRDSQLGVSTSTRMLVDNAASVCGPMLEVDLDQVDESRSPATIRPFAVWYKDRTSANGGRAVQEIRADAHITELQSMTRMFVEFADTETFVNALTGGDMESLPSEALRTQGNMSMAMGAAALPFKDIVRNFDAFTISVVKSLVAWNTEYHERKDELVGDLRPVARGASSLMAKEVRAYTLDALANNLNPEDELYIDREALLKERLLVRDLPIEKLFVGPDEVERRRQERAEAASKQQQQADQMFNAELRAKDTESLKDTVQAQKNLGAIDNETAKIVLMALEKQVDPDVFSRAVAAAAGTRNAPEGAGPQSGNPEVVQAGAGPMPQAVG